MRDHQGWRNDWQNNHVLRRQTPNAASQWAQDIPVDYMPYAKPWASWSSNKDGKNTGSWRRISSVRLWKLDVSCQEMTHKAETQLKADLWALCLAPQTPLSYYPLCDYFRPYNVKIGHNKTKKHYGVIFTRLITRSHPSGISCWHITNGIYPGAKKVMLHPWIPGSAVECQWVTNGWRRVEIMQNSQRFRFWQTPWLLHWKKHQLVVHRSSCPSSEQMCWGTWQKL